LNFVDYSSESTDMNAYTYSVVTNGKAMNRILYCVYNHLSEHT